VIAILASLVSGVYIGFKNHYGFTETYEVDVGGVGNKTINKANIANSIEQLDLLEGLQGFGDGLFRLANPSGITDILGGLMQTALGLMKTLFGVVLFPAQIFTIIIGFYPNSLGGTLVAGLTTMLIVYLGFIWLSARARGEL